MKFTLRDLFWLVLIAAILSAWFIDHRVQWAMVARERAISVDAIMKIDAYNNTLIEENEKLRKEVKALAAQLPKLGQERF